MADTLLGIRFGVSTSEDYDSGNRRVDREHEATYVVQMDSTSDREPEVAMVSGVPAIGSISAINTNARCVSREIVEVGPCIWEVRCVFSTNYRSEPTESDPWDLDPTWSWGVEFIDEPLQYDAKDSGKAIVNSALEPFVPPTYPVAVPVLTINRYEETFDPDTILNFVNHVNSASFWGAAAGKALMAGISAAQETVNGVNVWKVTYTIKFKMDSYGWKLRLLDQGTYYWSGAVGTSQKVPFGDKGMQQVVGNLNGTGGKNTTTTPAFVEYNRYDEANFATLSLGPWV